MEKNRGSPITRSLEFCIGAAIAIPILVPVATSTILALTCNEFYQQGKRAYYILKGHQTKRVSDELNFFPYYRIKQNRDR
jgi:hypothetical protein